MLNLNDHLLAILNLSAFQLNQLASEEEQKIRINKRYFELAFLYHPSNQFTGNVVRYEELNNAYRDIFVDEEEDIIPDQNAPILDNTFDFIMQEDILRTYDRLLMSFATLQTQEQKVEFIQRHLDFFDLAERLEQQQALFNQQRVEQLMQFHQASFWRKYQHEWRKLMISLFAEEYLDDFQYQQAIATGRLGSILALRKVLSPVKLLVAIINSVILAVRLFSQHVLIHKILAPAGEEFFQLIADARNRSLNRNDAAVWMLKFSGILTGLAALCLPVIFFPITSFFLLSLPVISNFLTILACPVNRIIRPLAQFFHCSPFVAGLALVLLLSLSAALYFSFFPITGFASLITPAILFLTAYTLYGLLSLLKKVYEVNVRTAGVMGAITLLALVLSVVISLMLPGSIVITPLVNLVICLFGAYLMDHWNDLFVATFQKSKCVETLSLPLEEPSEELKETVFQHVRTAHYSAKFFNTNKEAEFIAKKDRTIWQQAGSFFGGGEKVKSSEIEDNDYSGMVMEGA